MDFKNSYRVEAVYFQKLKSDIDIAKSYIAAGATDDARAVLENLVDVDGAVLLLYRNIGECWAELANAIEKTKKELDALRDQQEQYHDELNEKIDEINNYIIRLINALDERLTAAEADIDDLQERMLAAESDIDDLEANKQDKLTPAFGIEIDANNEISVDTDDVQEKLIAGQNITLTPDTTDPTKTVIDAAGESYTSGFGIDIDANNEISVDTDDVQEKLIAGQNITLTPDSTDPTKTVISADGSSYNSSSGIIIKNGKISNDLSSDDSKTVIAKANDTTKKSGSAAAPFSLTWLYDTGNPVDLFAGVDKDKVNYLRIYLNLLIPNLNATAINAIYALPLNSVQLTFEDIKLNLSYTDENNVSKTVTIFFEPVSRILSVVDYGTSQGGKVTLANPGPIQAIFPIDSAHNYQAVLTCKIVMNTLGGGNGGTFQSEMLTIYNNLPALNAYVFLHGKSGMNI